MIKDSLKVVKHFLIAESPTILTGFAVTGLISSVYLGIRATPEALNLIRHAEVVYNLDEGEELSNREVLKLTWRCYIPTALMIGVTASCIIGANSIHLGRTAAISAAYKLTEKVLNEYQAKVEERLGKKKEGNIRDDIAQDKLLSNPIENREIILTGKGDTLFYESLSGRYFKTDMETVRKIVNDLNEAIIHQGYVLLNDFYYLLGLEANDLGRMGWDTDKLLEIHFSAKITSKQEPCIVIQFKSPPKII